MIVLTRLNGEQFALNVDRVERAERTPDTVITMEDGTKYVVAESLDEVIAEVAEFKARVLRLASSPEPIPPRPEGLRLVRDRDNGGTGGGPAREP